MKEDPAILETFLSLVLLLFLRYNPRFPLAYKRESRVSHEGDSIPIEITSNRSEHNTNTRLSSNRALDNNRSFFPLET